MSPRIALIAAAPLLAAAPAFAQVPTNTGPATVYSSVDAPIITPNQDGKVTGLNPATYRALSEIKRANPGSLTEANANQLKAAVMADNKIDPIERDLLEELVQSQFRNIRVTPAAAAGQAASPQAMVTTFPTVGNAKRVFLRMLRPELDLNVAWTQAGPGWNAMIAEYKKGPQQEVRVVNFIAGKLGDEWEKSNMGNGYKPYRDLIGRLYGFSNSALSDTGVGRAMIFRAAQQQDRTTSDAVPDFLYNWLRPGGRP